MGERRMKDSFIDELIRAEGFIPAELQVISRCLRRGMLIVLCRAALLCRIAFVFLGSDASLLNLHDAENGIFTKPLDKSKWGGVL